MKKVSRKPFTFVPEVSNYSRGIFFRKVRSFYSLLSIYSEEIFFCKKKVSRKPLTFVPEVSNSSRGIINYREFLKTPPQNGLEMSIYSEGGWKIFCKIPRQTVGNFPIIIERIFLAVSHKDIAEKSNEIRSENDETKHKLRNLRRIITRNR